MSTDLDTVASTHYCPDCEGKSRLWVRWNWTDKRDEVYCTACGRTDGFRRKESLMAQWRRAPESVPVQIANIFERKAGTQPMSEQALVQATETQMVKRIEQARWLAELKPADRQSLAHLAVRYGLDPLMKELTLYEGAPYISIAGLIRIAHRQKMFAGLEDRPMTSEERAQYGYKAPFCWLVKVYRKDWRCPAVGTGTADSAQPFRNNPIERTRPEWMARSRAIRQALKLAFPHSLPFEEVESAEEQGIDPETGEIIDSTAVEVPSNGYAAPVAKAEAVEIDPDPMPASHLCAECVRQRRPSTIEEQTTEKGRYWSPEEIATKSQERYGEELCWSHFQGLLRADAGIKTGKARAEEKPISEEQDVIQF